MKSDIHISILDIIPRVSTSKVKPIYSSTTVTVEDRINALLESNSTSKPIINSSSTNDDVIQIAKKENTEKFIYNLYQRRKEMNLLHLYSLEMINWSWAP